MRDRDYKWFIKFMNYKNNFELEQGLISKTFITWKGVNNASKIL